MTQEFLDEINALSLKFSSGKRAEDINNVQSARHMVTGVIQGLSDEKDQAKLFQQLRESEGKSLVDLSRVINLFLMEKTNEIRASRHVIGKLKLERRSVDNGAKE